MVFSSRSTFLPMYIHLFRHDYLKTLLPLLNSFCIFVKNELAVLAWNQLSYFILSPLLAYWPYLYIFIFSCFLLFLVYIFGLITLYFHVLLHHSTHSVRALQQYTVSSLAFVLFLSYILLIHTWWTPQHITTFALSSYLSKRFMKQVI